MGIHNIYKPLGWTPFEALKKLKDNTAALKDETLTYAGRLDPMAEGVLVLLSGPDRYQRDFHLTHRKTYEAEMLFGYTTDTYDALGLPVTGTSCDSESIKAAFDNLIGIHLISFPPYSSYKVQGRPLLWWARENRLDEIEIPVKDMQIYSLSNLQVEPRSTNKILSDIEGRIKLVRGDFRQNSIINAWQDLLNENTNLHVAKLTIEVSGGTYIRSIANKIGQDLGCGAILLNLKRTQVGPYLISDSIQLTA